MIIHSKVGWLELAVEVIQSYNGHQRPSLAATQHVEPYDALGMLRQRNPHHIGNGRGDINRAQIVDHNTRAHCISSGKEGSPHIDVGIQVLQIGHVAVLPEEVRERHQCARGRGIELIRRIGEDDQVPGAGGMRHIRRAVWSVGDIACFGLREDAVDYRPVLGLAVACPIVGILQPKIGFFDHFQRGSFLIRGDLLEAFVCWLAAFQVQIDLNRAARPARFRHTNGLSTGRSAV